ncbi:Cytochrome P450 monooxygenase himC [Paramyrothecium foliicola]|nr:Cytochrome P450 monooxygenase himC [Paramyrothecium foliicola]
MITEYLYLSLLLVSGALVPWILAGKLYSSITQHHISSHVSALPLWATIPIAAVFSYASRKHLALRNMRRHGCKPAPMYPHRDRVLGTDWLFDMSKAVKSHKLLETWDNLFQKVAGTFWIQNVGSWIIMTNEPENIKALLAGQFESWPIGGLRQYFALLALGRHAIFSVNGAEWQHARAMIRPSFVRNQIADLECTDRHLDHFLAKIPRDGSKIDLQKLFYMFMMDISTDFMFGHSTNLLVSPAEEAVNFLECFDYALSTASTRGRLGWIAFWFPDKRLDQSVQVCKRFIDRYMTQALSEGKSKERPYIFMNEMIDAGAPPEYIRDQLLAMILGGRDTSASTMTSLFWVLARRPDVVKKLRQEILETLGSAKPTWTELKDMKYLNMVIKEVLRLYAPVPTNFRLASEDVVLPKGGGPDGQSPLFVPKGSGCRWSLYSLHRRKDIYGEDAEEFRPERWETLRTSMSLEPTDAQDEAGHLLPHTTLSGDGHEHKSRGLPITALEIGVIVGTVLAFAAGLFFVFYCRQSERARNSSNVDNGGDDATGGSTQRNQEQQGEELTTQSPKPQESTHWYMAVVQKLGPRNQAEGAEDGSKVHLDTRSHGFHIVVERLSKNMTQQHLYEIFGQFGPITDLDLPINRTFGTNRGTAYILFDHLSDAEAAITHMHEAQVDGAIINVSIVLPRRKLSPAPPTARRGANIDPRVPFTGGRGGGPSGSAGVGGFNGGGAARRHPSPSSRYGPRSDVYRPGSRSPSRSSVGGPPSRGGASRYRERSVESYSSRSRSRSPGPRRKGASKEGNYDYKRRTRSPSYGSYNDRDRSQSPVRGGRGHR